MLYRRAGVRGGGFGMVNTKVNLGGLEMPTPVATASGTFGYGLETKVERYEVKD